MEEKRKKRILHVDDEPDSLEVVKTILEKEGFEVVGMALGTKAIEAIKSESFDLIILDIMMPDMTGWELFTEIMKVKPNYKVVFLTILELSKEKEKELIKAGVKDYIRKPFDRDDLVKRIKNVVYGK